MGQLRDNIEEQWARLDPTHRRWAVLGGSAVAGLGLLYLAMAASGQTGGPAPTTSHEDTSSRLLTDSGSQEMSMSALSAEIEQLRQSRRDMQNKMSQLKTEMEKSRKQRKRNQGEQGPDEQRSGPDEVTQRKINALRAQVETLRQELTNGSGGGDGDIAIDTVGGDSSPSDDRDARQRSQPSVFEQEQSADTSQQARASRTAQGQRTAPSGQQRTGTQQKGESQQAQQSQGASQPASVSVFAQGPDGETTSVSAQQDSAEDGDSESNRDQGVFIPAGSMVSGTLLTGLDAPTGTQAQQEPVPVLLRIKHEAILPNRYRADVRECFMVASGHGSISARRVKLRSETLSCIREDGGVVEAGLGAWAVSGEDGKEGIEGRLVNRQGQVLGRSMLAGFASGFSELFGQQQIPTLETSPDQGGSTPFQSVASGEATQAASVQGAGQALDRLAQFYIDMAEQMFPVIEVNAGRKVTFVVNKGTRLRIRGNRDQGGSDG